MSLQLRRQFTDQALDLFRLVTVTNQDRVSGPHHDEIVNSEQRNVGAVITKNDVVSRIGNRCLAVDRVAVFVLFEIFRHGAPASDVVPVEGRFDDQHAVGLFHDRVVERDARQLAETFFKTLLEIPDRPKLRNKIGKLGSVAVELAQ